tara:strand:- start:308 stop:523 length:216 start_codon:yes stop_codon:yes gene_type:complete
MKICDFIPYTVLAVSATTVSYKVGEEFLVADYKECDILGFDLDVFIQTNDINRVYRFCVNNNIKLVCCEAL